MTDHHYKLIVKWTGNQGEGTKDVRSYERSLVVSAEGKPELQGSADPAFKGDPSKYNPEELLVAALSTCHMLSYLYLCAVNKIVVTAYVDQPTATMSVDQTGNGRFKETTLFPQVTITDPSRIADAEKLHEEAHHKCFIANSVNFPVNAKPTIKT